MATPSADRYTSLVTGHRRAKSSPLEQTMMLAEMLSVPHKLLESLATSTVEKRTDEQVHEFVNR